MSHSLPRPTRNPAEGNEAWPSCLGQQLGPLEASASGLGQSSPALPVPVRPSEARSRGDWEGLGDGVLVKMHGHPGLTLGSSLPDPQRGALRSHCVATGRHLSPCNDKLCHESYRSRSSSFHRVETEARRGSPRQSQASSPASGRTMVGKARDSRRPGLTIGGCHCAAVQAPATGMPCKERGYAV